MQTRWLSPPQMQWKYVGIQPRRANDVWVNTDTSFSQEISMNNDVPDYFAEIREIHNDHGQIIFVTGHGLAHHLA